MIELEPRKISLWKHFFAYKKMYGFISTIKIWRFLIRYELIRQKRLQLDKYWRDQFDKALYKDK